MTEENDVLIKRIASIDENAITRLRDKKDAEIKELQERLGKAESAAIRNYADGKDNDFQAEQGNAVAWGIIAQTFEYGLDPTDEKQRRMAAAYLLEKVSWTGISSDFKISLTASRTRQLCDVMGEFSLWHQGGLY